MSEFIVFFRLDSIPVYKHSVEVLGGGWYLTVANKEFGVGARVIPGNFFPQPCGCSSRWVPWGSHARFPKQVWLLCFGGVFDFVFPEPSEPWAPRAFAFADQHFHICSGFPLSRFAHLSTSQFSVPTVHPPAAQETLPLRGVHCQPQNPGSSPNYLPGDGLTWLQMSVETEENKASCCLFVFPILVFDFKGSGWVFHHFTGLSARASRQRAGPHCAESWSFYEGIGWFRCTRPKAVGEVRAHTTSSAAAVLRVVLCPGEKDKMLYTETINWL